METIEEYIIELSKFLKEENSWQEILDEYESHLRAEFDDFVRKSPDTANEKSFVRTLEKPEEIYIGLIGKKSIFTINEFNKFPAGRFSISYVLSIIFMLCLNVLGSQLIVYIPGDYYRYQFIFNPFLIIFWPISLVPTNGIDLYNYFAILTLFFFSFAFLLVDQEFLYGLKSKKVFFNAKFKIAFKFFFLYLFIGFILSMVALFLQVLLYGKNWIDPFYDFSPIILWLILIPFGFHWISIIFALISILMVFFFYKFDILKFKTDIKKIKVIYLIDFQYKPFLEITGNFLFAYLMGAVTYFYSNYFLYFNDGQSSFIAELHYVLADSILWPYSIINILAFYNYRYNPIYGLPGQYSYIYYSFLYAGFIFIWFILFPISKLIRFFNKQTKFKIFNESKDLFGKIMIIYVLCAIFNFLINISLVTWNNIRLFGYYSDGYDYNLPKETFLWFYYSLPPFSSDWFSHLPALALFIFLTTFLILYKVLSSRPKILNSNNAFGG